MVVVESKVSRVQVRDVERELLMTSLKLNN